MRRCSPGRLARSLASIRQFLPASLGGLSTRPRRSAATVPRSPSPLASPRPPDSSTTPAPSARFRLGTTCPAGLTQGSSRSWLTSTASTWTRPLMLSMISWSPTRERPSSCDSRPRSSPPFPFAARHAGDCTGPNGPHRCRQLSPRASSFVHRRAAQRMGDIWRFPAGRPRWEDAGAKLVDDVEPFERRKLWLLNGSHSMLAYAGSIRSYETIDEAIADPRCRSWVEAFWDEASRYLTLPASDIADYRAALVTRFSNPRVRHQLAQIAPDGSIKLRVCTLPTVRAERSAGRVPIGCATTIAAWVLHLRGLGAPIKDPGAGPAQKAANSGELREAVPAVLEIFEPGLGSDKEFVDAVIGQAGAIQSE